MTTDKMRTHYCGDLRPEHVGQTVSVCGWVARRREHGEHLAFLDVRDRSGIVQCVINSQHDARSEYVVRITGVVRQRPEGTFETPDEAPPVYVIDVAGGTAARDLTAELRRAGIGADRAFDGRSMKSQMKSADRSGARVAVIVGDEEHASGAVTVRPLRDDGEQERVPREKLLDHLKGLS